MHLDAQTFFSLLMNGLASGSMLFIVACGGWSKRRTLYGGDRWRDRQDDLLANTDGGRASPQHDNPLVTQRGPGDIHCGQEPGERDRARPLLRSALYSWCKTSHVTSGAMKTS